MCRYKHTDRANYKLATCILEPSMYANSCPIDPIGKLIKRVLPFSRMKTPGIRRNDEICKVFAVLIGQSSFSVAGRQMWNDLPIDVRSAQSLMMFRKHLKTYLFRRHYLA